MNHILICSTPAPGHVNPMLAVACYLRDSGYRITFNTAEVFRRRIESEHLRFVPFTGFANFDYLNLDEAFPDRKNHAPGPEQLIHDFKHAFGRPIPDQYRGILEIMDETNVDVVLTDVTFLGTFPLLLGPQEIRQPIISCGVARLSGRAHGKGRLAGSDVQFCL